MKLKIILALALLLDVVLAGMVVHLRGKPEAQPPASSVAAVKSEAPPRARPATARPLPLASPNRPAQGFDWRVIESEDYTQYIANLRGIGCPEETIRDIIIADVNKLYESRKQDSRKQAGPFKYWKAGQPILSGSDPERMKQHQALDQEKRELLKALLGANAPEAPDPKAQAMSQLGEALDFLPPEKQAKAMGAMQELQAKIAQAAGNRGGQPGTNDPARIKALIDEYNVSLSQWLTPAEKEQFDLTVSQTAQSMRNQLGAFDPTEQEFRDIYKIRKPFDDEFQFANRSSDPAVIDRREAAYFETERQLRQLLGDARYAEYRTSRDYIPNTPLRQIAEAEGIPPERATQVLELRDLAREQALRVRLDATLNDAQRELTLAAIQSQTRSAINGMLGEKAATAYFEKPVARRWFDGLMPGRLAEARTVPPPGP